MCLAMNPDKLVGDQLCASLVQPQLQGPPGLAHRPHPADEPGHGRRRRRHRRGRRRPRSLRASRAASRRKTDHAKTRQTSPSITGHGVAVAGNDIDTDRIIPARFLKCVTFDGLGEHVFEDDRKTARDSRQASPPSTTRASRAPRVLFVDRNFGCGSSREHAPQALMRWGTASRRRRRVLRRDLLRQLRGARHAVRHGATTADVQAPSRRTPASSSASISRARR